MKGEANKIVAVIYTRVSSSAQMKKGDGLASQETRCREFARMKGYKVAEVFSDEAVSGGIIDRPGMQAMLRYLRQNKAKAQHVVLIDDISRLARDIKAHLDLRAAIGATGARLESPSVEFGEDSDSTLVENLLASVSQHQREKNAEQTKNRMRSRVLNGYYPFYAPMGYKSERQSGRGNVLVRDEPLATIIEEALRGFASGRFQTQAEVKRSLEYQPEFPITRHGTVTNETANRILNRVVYAGKVEREEWGVSLREGQHEGLITYQEYLQIQERLAAGGHAPARADIDDAFPLRGAVVCADCDHPLTACWSKGRTRRYPYYQCFNTKGGCPSARKSIPKDEIEGAFAEMLETLTPTQTLFAMVSDMFRNVWDQRAAQAKTIATALKASLVKIDAQVDALVDRIVDADSTAVAKAYEKQLAKLQSERLLLNERLETSGKPI